MNETETVEETRQIGAGHWEIRFAGGGTLKVPTELMADFSLYAGRELLPEEYARLREAAGLARAKARAMRMLSARPMSCRELADRLMEKGESAENTESCVLWLEGLHFLDDANFAAMVVRHCAGKGYGRRRVQAELARHKVPRELWDEALEENLPEQDGALDRFLQSRLRGAEPDRAAVKKAADALARRGYGWEEIRDALSRYRQGLEEE